MQWMEKVQEVLFNPSEYFKQMPTEGGYRDPTIFALKNITIYSVLSALISYVGFKFLSIGMGLGSNLSGATSGLAEVFVIVGVIAGIIGGIVGVYLGSAIVHVFLYLLGGKGDYESTFRVASSVTATTLFSWIPFVNIIAGIYALFLQVIGFSEVHEISKARSLFAILLPILIVVAIVGVMFMLFFSMMSTMPSTVSPGMVGNFLLD